VTNPLAESKVENHDCEYKMGQRIQGSVSVRGNRFSYSLKLPERAIQNKRRRGYQNISGDVRSHGNLCSKTTAEALVTSMPLKVGRNLFT
jgi:hypothetical protein